MTIQYPKTGQSQSLATEAPVNYMPDMEPDDYAPPEYRLVQFLSKAATQGDIPVGTYHCEATGDTQESIYMVILRIQRTMTRWERGQMEAPACQSSDRIMPQPGGSHPGPCKTCPARGQDCYPGYNLVCLLADPNNMAASLNKPEPFLLRVNGTSVFGFRKLWSLIQKNYRATPWAAITLLESEHKDSKSGEYYIMAPSILGPVEDGGVLASLKEIADSMMASEVLQAAPAPPGSKIIDAPVQYSVTGSTLRKITLEEAKELLELMKERQVSSDLAKAYMANAFQINALKLLNTGQWSMLKSWIYQEYPLPPVGQPETKDPMDDLPF